MLVKQSHLRHGWTPPSVISGQLEEQDVTHRILNASEHLSPLLFSVIIAVRDSPCIRLAKSSPAGRAAGLVLPNRESDKREDENE